MGERQKISGWQPIFVKVAQSPDYKMLVPNAMTQIQSLGSLHSFTVALVSK